MLLRFTPEIWELVRKIVLLLCRKYGFHDLTTDYNENHGKNGRFASSNSSGASSSKQKGKQKTPKQEGKPQPAQKSIKASLRPKGAQTPKGKDMLALFRAKGVKENQAKQKQHLTPQAAREATAREQEKNPGTQVIPKSYFTKKMQSVRDSVLTRIKNGDFEEVGGQHNSLRFQLTFKEPVGYAYDKRQDKFVPSSTVEAVCSIDDGYHMWPVLDDKKRG